MLAAENIARSYPTRAGELVVLREVSLTLEPGRSVAIVGPSGSGKSTLLNILATLDRPTAGRVRLGDVDPFALGPAELARFRNREVGLLFQESHLLPQCSVLENVLVPTLAGRPDGDELERARSLLARLGLEERLDHRPGELSGGEKQRVALARALVNRPRLVLADEPTGNLDGRTAEGVGELLAELPRGEAVMLVCVTHSPALAVRFDAVRELAGGLLR